MNQNNLFSNNDNTFPVCEVNSETLTKMNFIDVLYDRMGLSRAEAAAFVDSIFAEISSALLERRDVKLANFGTFSLHDKVARPGRNPQTGDAYEISARTVVTFLPAPHLKDSVASYAQAVKQLQTKEVA